MLVGISDEKRVLPPDKCRSPVGGHEKGLSPSWISYPLMQFLDALGEDEGSAVLNERS